jgi:argininosuccinate lyase
MSRLRGRFDSPTSEAMQRFSSSLEVDLEMVQEEIAASRAHATMLGETGLLTEVEVEDLQQGLERVGRELREGTYQPGSELEDVHMAVEARLVELLGETGRKLHTARSRNDQVATDVRLWLKRRLAGLDEALADLLGALVGRIEADGRILMPGYTHLQRGQPILLGHHLLGHAWPLLRDRQRLAGALRRLDASPLGACAMAGTSHPIDRRRTAERDHLQEVAATCAIAMTHLSRMAAELVLWSSSEFRFVRLSEDFATGSSIMPQKRNPDAAELVRGKAGRVYGDLMALLTLVKGLPLAYNRDLQEGREAIFDAVKTTLACVRILAQVWRSLEIDPQRFEGELVGDFSLATELADAMVKAGVSFRQSHDAVGALVLRLEQEQRSLADLSPQELADLHPCLSAEGAELLDPRRATERRVSHGGTAWPEIERQLDLIRSRTERSKT